MEVSAERRAKHTMQLLAAQIVAEMGYRGVNLSAYLPALAEIEPELRELHHRLCEFYTKHPFNPE